MNLNFPRTFLSYKIKTKTDKREEFNFLSNEEFGVTKVEE